jgi:hypothetical protein
MSGPISFYRLKRLLEKEWEILPFGVWNSQTLDVYVRALLEILFEKHNNVTLFIKHLQ